jgi:hypothetical protein
MKKKPLSREIKVSEVKKLQYVSTKHGILKCVREYCEEAKSSNRAAQFKVVVSNIFKPGFVLSLNSRHKVELLG